MPIFDFECAVCAHTYEKVLFRSDQVPECPECRDADQQVKKVTGVGNVYATDDDAPKTTRDLQNYLGNGQYMRGYKKGG